MRTFEYSVTETQALSLDVYAPEGHAAGHIGTVLYLHGGGFAVGDRAMDADRVRALTLHGLTVVVPDYRLAPVAKFPNQVDDVRAAVKWVREHADELGVTSSKVGLWGASAGAVLGALTALTARADDDQVQAVASWFGFSDIETSASRSPLESAILPPGPEHALLGVDDLARVPELVRQASPINHVTADAPPFLISHGDRDHVVDPSESLHLHQALTKAGARSTLLIQGGAGHEDPRFDAADNIAITAAFLRTHLSEA